MPTAKLASLLHLFVLTSFLPAQTAVLVGHRGHENRIYEAAALPNAPEEGSSAIAEGNSGDTLAAPAYALPMAPRPVAPRYDKYIAPEQSAQPLNSKDKVLLGLHELESPLQLVTITSAAAYEHAVNGSPNYGTNLGAYGQRVGAAAVRDASRTIFTDSIAAPLLHEDPRYYILGSSRNPVVRAGYAITRVFVTRTDSGNTEPNYALFLGYAGVAGLNNAFYPPDNQGFSETAKGFAGSLGGAAIGNVAREFLPDLLRLTHLQR